MTRTARLRPASSLYPEVRTADRRVTLSHPTRTEGFTLCHATRTEGPPFAPALPTATPLSAAFAPTSALTYAESAFAIPQPASGEQSLAPRPAPLPLGPSCTSLAPSFPSQVHTQLQPIQRLVPLFPLFGGGGGYPHLLPGRERIIKPPSSLATHHSSPPFTNHKPQLTPRISLCFMYFQAIFCNQPIFNALPEWGEGGGGSKSTQSAKSVDHAFAFHCSAGTGFVPACSLPHPSAQSAATETVPALQRPRITMHGTPNTDHSSLATASPRLTAPRALCIMGVSRLTLEAACTP